MTGRQKIDAEEKRQAVFARDNWTCVVCGNPLTTGVPQLAHRIPKRQMYLRMYGPAIIHHPANLASVCSLECNAAIDIGGNPVACALLAKKIKEIL